ncbi:MAG: hypothetical protein QG575_2085, partial [Euryarchaeota archaeon]|nr:hypothetical protein [Euryarchaeota archaeon]
MDPLTPAGLLSIWERGRNKGLVEKGLILLAEACPDASLKALAEIPIGRRDAIIFRLREMTFGPWIAGLSTCPSCGEQLELTIKVADILYEQTGNYHQPMILNFLGYEVHFRLPCSRDLFVAVATGSMDAAYNSLIEESVQIAYYQKHRTSAQDLPADVIQAMAEEMVKVDPQADVQMKITCSSCGHQWQQTFDIICFFWKEIDSWAHRILREVDALARAYGWGEADILSLSSWRRQCY